MKTSLILLISIVYLMACNDTKNANPEGEKAAVEQVEPIKLERKDPTPKTITIKEVSRIALVEAKQFLTQAKQKDVDYSTVVTIYDEAQAAFDKGDYKESQILAVKVRQQIEEKLHRKKLINGNNKK
jgi:hypothetical protein